MSDFILKIRWSMGARVWCDKTIHESLPSGTVVGYGGMFGNVPLTYIILLDEPIYIDSEPHRAITVPGSLLNAWSK